MIVALTCIHIMIVMVFPLFACYGVAYDISFIPYN